MKFDVYLKNVSGIKLNKEKCTGCKMCLIVCPHEVFEMFEKKSRIKNKDYCMECGACALNCHTQAISVKSGVGCVAGVINGFLKGTEPTCDCNNNASCC